MKPRLVTSAILGSVLFVAGCGEAKKRDLTSQPSNLVSQKQTESPLKQRVSIELQKHSERKEAERKIQEAKNINYINQELSPKVDEFLNDFEEIVLKAARKGENSVYFDISKYEIGLGFCRFPGGRKEEDLPILSKVPCLERLIKHVQSQGFNISASRSSDDYNCSGLLISLY